jgi:hypothetical protein
MDSNTRSATRLHCIMSCILSGTEQPVTLTRMVQQPSLGARRSSLPDGVPSAGGPAIHCSSAVPALLRGSCHASGLVIDPTSSHGRPGTAGRASDEALPGRRHHCSRHVCSSRHQVSRGRRTASGWRGVCGVGVDSQASGGPTEAIIRPPARAGMAARPEEPSPGLRQ